VAQASVKQAATGGQGPPSPKRVPLATVEEVLRLYQERYHHFDVRHFHEKRREAPRLKLRYTWVKLGHRGDQGAGLVKKGHQCGAQRHASPESQQTRREESR
jgi:hypothetical protein